ncbi:MAG: ammonia-forming cytochrome c nitrite reductase subunit c552 [Chlorobi bacterium]|nr:ammonia-forming cytochrome c nitrite reductase subunit c552 [Chlorobiota bacterium]
MKTQSTLKTVIVAVFAINLMMTPRMIYSQSTLDCKTCHNEIFLAWLAGSHSHTQKDIALELAAERIGQSADTVINGSDAENCIACHAPLAITENGGMTEVQALEHFFTTTGGVFTSGTTIADSANWPHNYCTTCHNVPGNHPTGLPEFGYFNSSTATYDSIGKVASLCGQCHGNLQFEGTDHLTYNAWNMSKHALTQDDVSSELAEERAGESPDTVVNGSDPENCIACHAPTAVLANGGMSESEALNYFFSTESGVFTANTTSLNGDQWPDVSCISCHNPHEPNLVSYFNSSTKQYEVMDSTAKLCGQCHGNLRFPGTDHLSYNIAKGVGAIGVTYKETMPGITCTDCHMAAGPEDTKADMYHGHSWSVFVTEDDGSETVACQNCHSSMDAAVSRTQIQAYKDEAAASLSSAEQEMSTADSLLNLSGDAELLAQLDSAKTNLSLVEGDESGGFHNHKYQMDLLADVLQKLDHIISVATGIHNSSLPSGFELSQNFPNPFIYYTDIKYAIPYNSYVHMNIYDNTGRLVKTVVNKYQNPGVYKVNIDMTAFPAGNYYYVLKAGNTKISKSMIILR